MAGFHDALRSGDHLSRLRQEQAQRWFWSEVQAVLADAIAAAETRFSAGRDAKALAADFYKMMTGLEFLPNSPTLMNAGRAFGIAMRRYSRPAVRACSAAAMSRSYSTSR